MLPRRIRISWTNGTLALIRAKGNRGTAGAKASNVRRSRDRAASGFSPSSSPRWPPLWPHQSPRWPQCRSSSSLPLLTSNPPLSTLPLKVGNPTTSHMGVLAGAFPAKVEEVKGAEEIEGARRKVANPVSISNEMFPVGGRLRLFKEQWSFDPWAFSVISKGLGWKWVSPPPRTKTFFQPSTSFLDDYVQDLLNKRVIKPSKSLQFQGRLFCVPKKDSDKKRVILDLSRLNKYIQCDRFQMLTISQIRTLLPRGVFTVSIDLTDAYWHIPIARRFSPYLGFRLNRQAYVFKTMPFGLNVAPRVFTKLTDSVIQILRRRGIQVMAYLDDWLVWATSKEECMKAVKEVIAFLESLGFQINQKKSRLQPSQKFQWLGLDWDLVNHELSLPPPKGRR